MLPSDPLVALLLIALIPGYAYLRLTEDARRPRNNSALDEFLEVLAVGFGTTGLALGVVILHSPDEIADVLQRTSVNSPAELKQTVIVGAVVAGLALVIACLGAGATRLPGRGSYSPNVWRSTLGLRRKRHIPYVILELKDDQRRVEGALHSYTTLDGDHPRDISLYAPRISKGDAIWEAGADFVIVGADEIAKVWLKVAFDPGQPRSRRLAWRRK